MSGDFGGAVYRLSTKIFGEPPELGRECRAFHDNFAQRVTLVGAGAGTVIGGVTGGILGATGGSVVPGPGTVAGGIAGAYNGASWGAGGGLVAGFVVGSLMADDKVKKLGFDEKRCAAELKYDF